MTDEQIIKAFEEILKNQNNKLSLIEQAVCADVLSLTKHQKAEIENLKADNEMYQKVNCLIAGQRDDMDKEIEELQTQMEWLTGYNKNLLDANTALSGEIEICKSEAIKEFVERLKKSDELYNCIRAIGNVSKIDCLIDTFDNLVKEITEVQE